MLFHCDDGNAEIEIEADSAEEAAQRYVDGGDWGDRSTTSWVKVHVWTGHDEQWLCADDECAGELDRTISEAAHDAGYTAPSCPVCGGDMSLYDSRRTGEESHKVTLETEEPPCIDSGAHDWQSPYDIVGGIKENPGVWGHGGGVKIYEACVRCGCGKVTDTWAQDPEDGQQGLCSVEYTPGKYDIKPEDEDEDE